MMSTESVPSVLPGVAARARRRIDISDDVMPSRSSMSFSRRYLWQGLQTTFPLFLADQSALLVGLTSVLWLGHLLGQDLLPSLAWIAVPLSLGLIVANCGLDLYPGIGLGTVAEIHRCALSASIVFGILLLATLLREGLAVGHCLLLGVSWVSMIILLPTFRQWTRRIAAKTSWWGQPLLVLGGDEEGLFAYRTLLATPEHGLRPIGVLDELHHHWAESIDADSYLGPLSDAARIAEQTGAFWAVISMARHADCDLALVIDRYAAAIPHLLILPDMGSPLRIWKDAHQIGGIAGLRIDERLLLPIPRIAKRAMELTLILLGSAFVLPVCAIIALLIKLTSPGPVIYGQTRVGVGGKTFTAWKFRSMVVDADRVIEEFLATDPARREEWNRYQKLKSDPRVTWIGRFIRKTSLDELPQLWNVVIGEMSLVGPRPMTPDQVGDYPNFHLYTRLRPGITGLWQISGRNCTTFRQRAEFDAAYVRNWSLWLDLVLLVRTVRVVLLCEGSY